MQRAALAVYPRVCGGTVQRSHHQQVRRGLSPRVRGNPVPGSGVDFLGGSIPACAGEPTYTTHGGTPCWVYPRVCGGTLHRPLPWPKPPGLSPRVRGNRRHFLNALGQRRSIPACAGEPTIAIGAGVPATVYPRVCGGTASALAVWVAVCGLSPRVRGNRKMPHTVPGWVRSIPACAGEPHQHLQQYDREKVYPRVCGGTRRRVRNNRVLRGLSPRVRGNPTALENMAMPGRSIPACAGEPSMDVGVAVALGVYPRVCGGTPMAAFKVPPRMGLSPRVRGNRSSARYSARYRRSIPACAGEPPGGVAIAWVMRVYPRVCGGTTSGDGVPSRGNGLSPRVRGNLQYLQSRLRQPGSIPACAGEPQSAGG